MGWVGCTASGIAFLKKYRYALFVVAAGILLLLFSGQENNTTDIPDLSTEIIQPTMEDSLARILCLIEGAGRVEVLLTPMRGAETLYQTDEDVSSGERSSDRRRNTVLITGDGRTETGLIRQVNPPTYRGAVIVCQGAGNSRVRLAVVQAVSSVTGLTSDRITVLKMK